MKKLLAILIWMFATFTVLGGTTTPLKVMFQARVATTQQGLIGSDSLSYHTVQISIVNGDNVQEEYWMDTFKNTPFRKGAFSVVLGSGEPLTGDIFQQNNPQILISVRLKDGSRVQTPPQPFSATPYAIQSHVAENVLKVDAKTIQGTFISPVQVSANLVVGKDTLFVDHKQKRIGVHTDSPDYPLDVKGILNASDILINGEDIESSFSWQRGRHNQQDFVYYMGNVGVGTNTPQYALDVSGSINAKDLRIQGKDWRDTLALSASWQASPAGNKSIYFDANESSDEAFVGIGTTSPRVKLDVRGGLRIGEFQGKTPFAGTMQYISDPNTGMGEFFGYNGEEWISLVGIQGRGVSGNLAVWSGARSLSSHNKLFWNSEKSFLGIGTQQPDARLHIRQDVKETGPMDLVRIESSTQDPIFTVVDGRVGIQTATPSYDLDVQGVVNAKNYFINGVQLNEALSSDTFWERENPLNAKIKPGYERIFYDDGYVGIGTAEPRNLLEIASPTSDPSITFDVSGQDLYTIGIENKNPDAFIISQGGNLTQPVFVFKNDKVGVGLNDPKANLHVKGNAGVLIEGELNGATTFAETGKGSKMIWVPSKAAFRAGYVNGLNWDLANLGLHSVGLGQNALATGIGSFVGGGKDNETRGNYSVVPGGYKNVASGHYSFAAGHEAKARHIGSFVWSDYTPTLNVDDFESSQPNQFLIRAYGGVGIGTNQTNDAALTIHQPKKNQFLLLARGPEKSDVISIASNGGLGIGTTDPGTSRLAIMDGKLGIGTTNAEATFTVVHPKEDNPKNILVVKSYASDTAGLMVTSSGNVGIGFNEDTDQFDNDEFSLFVKGSIKATEFRMVDPKDPDRTITLSPNPGSPWTDPSKSDSNSTSRTQGFIGIGTPSPNYLLELSNRSIEKTPPIISFDDNNIDRFILGVLEVGTPKKYLFGIQPGETLAQKGAGLNEQVPFVVGQDGVGIGIGNTIPLAPLHVSGNMIARRLVVGTENVTSPYILNVDGGLNTKELYIMGTKFEPSDTPWLQAPNSTHIYYNKGNVGINTTTPSTPLEVNGTISANTVEFTNPMRLDGDLAARHVILENYAGTSFSAGTPTLKQGSNPGQIFVEDGVLSYKSPEGKIKKISSDITKVDGTKGKLAFWSDIQQNAISKTNIEYDMDKKSLTLSGNFQVNRRLSYDDYFIDTSVQLGSSSNMIVSANLDHRGNTDKVRSFSAEHINLTIADNYGSEREQVQLVGMDISMETMPNKKLLNLGRAVGVNVDMRNLEVKSGETGQKYAAVFMGGNVGIGTTQPSTELEVVGTVSANNFTLTGGLEVPTLRITGGVKQSSTNDYIFVADSTKEDNKRIPRIGVGYDTPTDFSAEFNVNGTVSANNMIITDLIKTQQLNVGNNQFVVSQNGNIGIGTSAPNGRLHIDTIVKDQPTEPLISEKVSILIDGASPGSRFFYDQDITNTHISMASTQGASNQISNTTANGLVVDLTDLELGNNTTAYGVHVDVSGGSGTRYAAVFNGGFVGIGTSNPTVELSVSGDIRANNLIISGKLESERATFNNLIVNKTVSINGRVSVNILEVSEKVTINSLTIQKALNAESAVFDQLTAESVTVNGHLTAATLNITQKLEAQMGIFSSGLAVGTSDVPSNGELLVSGNMRVDNLVVGNQISTDKTTININSNTLFMSDAFRNRVGIGTPAPTASLHIVDRSPSTFSAKSVGSWGTMRIHSLSGVNNTAAGLALIPDPDPNSNVLGAGIVAIRSADQSTQYASHLAFITDPNDFILDNTDEDRPKPKERMRITSEGLVGINTTEPLAQLDVVGDMRVSGDLTVDNTLSVSTINAPGSLTLSAASTIFVDAPVTFNQRITAAKGLMFKTQTPPADSNGFGQLFVNQSDNDLYYMKPNNSIPINLSAPYTGTAKRIPYYGADGNFKDDAPLSWDSATNQLILGDANSSSNFQTTVNITNTTALGSYSVHDIQLGLGDRSGRPVGVAGYITGLGIKFDSLDGSSTNPGRLAENETAVGLAVDVRALNAQQFVSGGSATGYKYAASFQGGSVGIGTALPAASLHVRSESSDIAPLIVETEAGYPSLVVSQNGFIGIGTRTPDSQVHIVGSDNRYPLRIVKPSVADPLFVVSSNGSVGIGINAPSQKLDVAGNIRATNGYFSEISAESMNIGNSAFVVRNSKIGLGTTDPSGYLHIVTTNLSIASEYTAQKTQIVLDNPNTNTISLFKQPIYGLDISAATTGTSQMQSTVNGLHVDLSGVSTNANTEIGRLYGAYIDTGTGSNRYAGIFMGGNVGIATENPTYALDVNGDIRANDLYISNSLSMHNVTINTKLIVQGVASFNNQVTVNNTLSADTVSANNIAFTGTLSVSTANVSTVNAQTAHIHHLKIGATNTSTYTDALNISGSALIDGDVSVNGTLAVTEITSLTDLTISANNLFITANSVTIPGNTRLSQGALQFQNYTAVQDANYAQLYLKDSDLMFLPKGTPVSNEINLSSPFTGTAGQVPVYNNEGRLVSTANLKYENDTLTIGAPSKQTQMVVQQTIPEPVSGMMSTVSVNMIIDKDGNNRNGTLTGLDIVIKPDQASTRLGPNQTAVGLNVDVSNLLASYTSLPGSTSNGTKFAAQFLGGNVGIGITNPSAMLHIKGETSGTPLLRLDGNYGSDSATFVVSANGNIGIGTTNPDGLLTLKYPPGSTSSTTTPYVVFKNNTTTHFTVLKNGNVGIATVNPTEKLSVNGGIKATDLIVTNTLSTKELTVGTSFSVSENGRIGFGVTGDKLAPIHLNQLIKTDERNATQLKLHTQLGDPNLGTGIQQTFSNNMTGLDLNILSNTGTNLEGIATGVSINMDQLSLNTNGIKRGIFVDMGTSAANHYAGIFMGGNVGIGTSNPTVELEVLGKVSANSLILTGSLDAHTITTNRLVVEGNVSMNADVTVNNMVANSVSANNLAIAGTFKTTNGEFTGVTSNTASIVQQLRINDLGNLVSSNAKLSVNGNVAVSGNISATTLMARNIGSDTGSIELNSNLTSSEGITAQKITATSVMGLSALTPQPSDNNEQGQLYMDTNNHLIYKFPGTGTSPLNISDALTGTDQHIPYYNASNRLTSSAQFTWNDDADQLQVGDGTVPAKIKIQSRYSSSTTSHQALAISTNIASLSNSAGTTVKGLDINMSTSGSTLGDKQMITGVEVNLQNISGTNQAIAGLFRSGRVGIGLTPSEMASAAYNQGQLVIKSDGTQDLIRTMSNANYGFVVDKNGKVGLGVANPTAQLSIKGEADRDIMVVSSNTSEAFRIKTNGHIGIASANPTARLSVTSGANDFYNFNINNQLVVTRNSLGIGLTNPTATLNVKGDVKFHKSDSSLGLFFNASNGRVGIGAGTPQAELHVSGNLGVGSVLPQFVANSTSLAVAKGASDYIQLSSGDNENKITYSDQLLFKDATNTRLVLRNDGKVGIGITDPTNQLEVVGTAKLGTSSKYLQIKTAGVGIGTTSPSEALHVDGNVSVNRLDITNDTIFKKITAKQVELDSTFPANNFTIHKTDIDITNSTSQDLFGYKIALSSELSGGRPASVFNGASAYGLHVDTTGVGSASDNIDDTKSGHVFSAAFIGGHVGIGTSQPQAALHVEKAIVLPATSVDLFQVSNTLASLKLNQDSAGDFHWKVDDVAVQTIKATNGNIGIGTTNPDKKLTVEGDIRIGSYDNSTGKLLFQDNNHYLTTEGNGSNSTLQATIGDAANNKFQVIAGSSPALTVIGNKTVGIGTASPETLFHVQGTTSGTDFNKPTDYLSLIDNDAAGNGLAIRVGYSGHGDKGNLLGFFSKVSTTDTYTGGVQLIANSNTDLNTVRFLTKGADYAEYLPKLIPTDSFEIGDIVGVINGKITFDTSQADHILVRSSSASVAGNWPGRDNVHNYALIAFFGQVQTKVRGPVQAGHYIIPSGLNDGVGIAVAKDDISIDQMGQIIGEAWSDHDGDGLGMVNVAVGFNFSVPKISRHLKQLDQIKADFDTVEAERHEMTKAYDQKLADQQKEIDRLVKALAKKGITLP